MQLGDQRASGNVEDRRGMGMAGGFGVGGIVVAIIAHFLGFDPGTAIDVAQQVGSQRETREAPKGAPSDGMGQFVSKVLGSTEDVWGRIFQQSKGQYHAPGDFAEAYVGADGAAVGLLRGCLGTLRRHDETARRRRHR
jgi:predicted metalloprotease